MPELFSPPPNIPALGIILIRDDVESAKNFYHKAFGLEVGEILLHDDGRMAVAELRWYGGGVTLVGRAFAAKHLPPTDEFANDRALIRVLCKDVDASFAHAVEIGATVVTPPVSYFWGMRMCLLADPFGCLWLLSSEVGEYQPPPDGV